MNIHITDVKFFESLKKATLVEIEVGSKMYGLSHDDSDKDLLCIYATSETEKNSFCLTHHQIQYKDEINRIDYIFVNIHNFLRNSLNGDSTINFEVINSDKLIDTPLEFLYQMRKAFFNYKILRSYLGLARRDIQRMDIDGKTEFGKNKKIAHSFRGFIFANQIYKYLTENDDDIEIKLHDYNISFIKKTIWEFPDYKERKKYFTTLLSDIDELRKKINKDLDEHIFIRFMSIENQKLLDLNLKDLIKSKLYQKCIMMDFDMNMIYHANEYDVSYD